LAPFGNEKIFISAGDISGDAHAAGLIDRCRKLESGLEWFGLGGRKMEAAGCRLLVGPETDPIMGFRRVVGRIPHFLGLLTKIHNALSTERPRLVILVDYPGLNIQIARLAKMTGIPVLYFICPQYWAWAPWRIHRFSRLVDRALVIFPFEKEYFTSHGVDTTYVGHPACDQPEPEISKSPPSLPAGRTLALLPGSRGHEVDTNLPVMLRAVKRILTRHPHLVPALIHHREDLLARSKEMADSKQVNLTTINGDIVTAARSARFCLVASGTATLEVALTGTPFVVIYRVSRIARRLAPHLLTVPWFCQVNLMAGQRIVPEFLLNGDDPAPILPECLNLSGHTPEREKMIARLSSFRKEYNRPGAIERAAREVLAFEEESTRRG